MTSVFPLPTQPALTPNAPSRPAMVKSTRLHRGRCLAGLSLALSLTTIAPAALAWQPTAPVELVVPAGTGGGADQMARFIQKLVTDKGLMPQPLNVVNRSGNSGIEGLLHTKAAAGNPHVLLISLSNLFTTPLATGTAFSWRDITPVQMLALDQFALWVNATSPYKSAAELVEELRKRPPGSMKLGGTGSRQEDQIISVLLETAAATRISYVALKGGGDVARALAAGEVDMTVNNPIEGEKLWREGALRPLCVFDGRQLEYPAKITAQQAWSDLPTCMSFGVPVQYLMMRGIFTTPGATAEQVAYYNQLLEKVMATPEWQAFMARGAFKPSNLKGPAFVSWLDKADSFHRVLMREAKFRAPPPGAPAAAPATKP